MSEFGRRLEQATGFDVQSYKTFTEGISSSGRGAAVIVDAELLLRLEMDDLGSAFEGVAPWVLALLSADEPSSVDMLRLVRAGVCGFLNAGCEPQTVRQAVASVCEGALWVSRKTICDFHDELCRPTDDECFTRREIHILRRIAAGRSNQSIADELSISRDTVRWHLRCAYSKLGVHDRKVAAKKFLERPKTWQSY
jgi:DNA-binding CsgD family transcriptional regulator